MAMVLGWVVSVEHRKYFVYVEINF
jgi:hypothetical protein